MKIDLTGPAFEREMELWRENRLLPDDQQRKTVLAYFRSREEHPTVFPAVAELCLEAKRRGYRKWSVNGAFEILRWQSHQTTGDLGIKVNNTYRAYTSRDLMLEYPKLWNFLRIRQLKPREDNWGHIH